MESTKIDINIQNSLEDALVRRPPIIGIIRALDKAGASIFLVGGAVRDLVLGGPIKDLDVEVHGLDANTLARELGAFGAVNTVGVSFGVMRLSSLDVDWSLPRSDSAGRKPVVVIDPTMDITSALRRRDLTMNAMAINLVSHEFIDPFGGRVDMARGVLRTPDVRLFVEDPLRFYRVMHFIGRFAMNPDETLNTVCATMSLEGVSRERISDEYEKLLLRSDNPSRGFLWLKVIDRLEELVPELAALDGVHQDECWHPEGDALEHTMVALDYAAQLEYENTRQKIIIMLATLCHDLGKAVTTEFVDGRWRSFGHAKAGVPLARKLLKRVTVKRDLEPIVSALVRYHMSVLLFAADGAGPSAYKWLARKLAPNATLELLALLARADIGGRTSSPDPQCSTDGTYENVVDTFLAKAHELNVAREPEPPVLLGRDLIDVIEPGQAMGRLLKDAYALQLEENIHDKSELKHRVLGKT